MPGESGPESLKIETEGLIEFKNKSITGFYIVCFGIVCQLISIAYTYITLNGSFVQIIRDLDNGVHKIIAGIWISGMIFQIIGFIVTIKGSNQLYNYLKIDITNQDHNIDLILNAVNRLDSKIDQSSGLPSNEIGELIIDERYMVTKIPHKSMKHDSIDSSNYEWLKFDDSNWYRTAGSEAEWLKFEN
ncbi:MAG: hypothetical protein HON10_01100 [Euryarchaeota archaeon]|nr:hypothetical protein [Euryarchaeota archaeon]MBT7988232.1 hypothetical protein [Euryarchaeota archaeon]